MPEPIATGGQPDENISNGGDEQNPPAGQEGGEAPKPPVTVTPRKVELTEEELQERIAAGIAAERERTEREAREKALRESGNVQELLSTTEAELKKTQLALWRSRALAKHELSDKWFDALNGETEKDIDNAARALKKRIDDEVAAREATLRAETPGTPPGGKGNPPQPRKVDGETKTRRNLVGAFNVGGLPRRNYGN